jgi:hypothetical protein
MPFWLDGKFCCANEDIESVFNDVIVPFFQNKHHNEQDSDRLNMLMKNLLEYKVSHDLKQISLGDIYALAVACLGYIKRNKAAPPEAIKLCQKAKKEVEKIIFSMNKISI